MAAGADAAVQSAHKMLAAMTMGAMLHIRGDRIDHERLCSLLGMLQSSSPSYPIMASLDLSRREIALRGEARIGQALTGLARLRSTLNESGPIRALPAGRWPEGAAADPFKLVLVDASGTLSGFALYNELAERGCYGEMADLRHALLAFSPYSSAADMQRLTDAAAEIGRDLSGKKQELPQGRANIIQISDHTDPISDPVSPVPPHQRSRGSVRELPRDLAAGRYSADLITPYPPGVPLVYPGERLHMQTIEYLIRLHEQGARIHGLRDPELRTLAVLDTP